MNVEFANRRVEACFADANVATRMWGTVVARRYIQRIQMLRHMSLADLRTATPLRFHALRGPKAGSYTIVLHDRWRIQVTLDGDTLRIEEVSNHYGD